MEDKFGIKHSCNSLVCFKVIIKNCVNTVSVVCPWSAQSLFEQVVNALNFGNSISIDTCRLPIADEGEQ